MTEHIATTEARQASLQRQARMAREQVERLTRQMSALEDDRQFDGNSGGGRGSRAAEQAVSAASSAEAARSAAENAEAACETTLETESLAAITCSRLTLEWQS